MTFSRHAGLPRLFPADDELYPSFPAAAQTMTPSRTALCIMTSIAPFLPHDEVSDDLIIFVSDIFITIVLPCVARSLT